MTWEEFEDEIFNLKVWKKGDKRAPHKHFLLLLMLKRAYRGEETRVTFPDIEKKLTELLEEFGPPTEPSPQNPFYHLSSSKIWICKGDVRPKNSPSKKFLRDNNFIGEFSEEVNSLLNKKREKIPELAAKIVNKNFDPESPELKEALLETIGFFEATPRVYREPRDSDFRKEVLLAYNGKCAICGFDGKLEFNPIGLDAAHIKWHKFKAPNTVDNGIALCPTHHRLFDRGAFTIDPETLEFRASSRMTGENLYDWLLRFNGFPLTILPEDRSLYPQERFLKWHWSEVFKGPVRYSQKSSIPNKAADD